MQKKIGLFGGTFDPIHLGHLLIAEGVFEKLKLDELIFIPAGLPPHKTHRKITACRHRLAMIRLATKRNKDFAVSDIEIKRAGKSFTYQTIEYFHERYSKDQLYFIMGMDTYRDLGTWNNLDRILELSKIVVVDRSGILPGRPEIVVKNIKRNLKKNVLNLKIREVEIFSSEIRKRIKRNMSTKYMLPLEIEKYINKHNLYNIS